MAIEDNQKGQEAQRPTTPSVPLQGGGGSGPVSGIGGMSPAERVSYIQELQRMSPLNKISDAVKKLTDNAFGLSRQAYDQADQQ